MTRFQARPWRAAASESQRFRRLDPDFDPSADRRRDAKQAMDRGNLSATRGKLSDFAGAVSAQSGKGIAVDAARVLVADTQYVLDTMN